MVGSGVFASLEVLLKVFLGVSIFNNLIQCSWKGSGVASTNSGCYGTFLRFFGKFFAGASSTRSSSRTGSGVASITSGSTAGFDVWAPL